MQESCGRGWPSDVFGNKKTGRSGRVNGLPAKFPLWGRVFDFVAEKLVGSARILRCRSRWGCRSIATRNIRHQANIHAAVLGTAIGGFVALHRLVLAQSNHVNLVSGNVVLAGQILNDCGRTALAEVVVVVSSTDGIRTAFDGDQVALGFADLAGKLVEGC